MAHFPGRQLEEFLLLVMGFLLQFLWLARTAEDYYVENSLCQVQLFCMSTYGIECSTNTRQVLTQFNEAAVYVGVSYVEEKEDFIQQVVICCYPSPARPVYICTIIVSCWSVHTHVLVQF